MLRPSWDNLDEFLDPDEFGVEVVLHLQDGTQRCVVCLFDEPYLDAQLGEYLIDTVQPRLTGKAADLEDVMRGDEVEVGGLLYDVVGGPQPDGTGMAILPLARK